MTYQSFAKTHDQAFLEQAAQTTDETAKDAEVPIRRFGKLLTAAIIKRCGRFLPIEWRILQWSGETGETVISSHGAVEIRQMPSGCLAQTLVKGELVAARRTAMVRLAKYVGGHNQRAVPVQAEWPILQQQKAPGLWLIGLRLPAIDDARTAPIPRTSKVRIVAQDAAAWAVITRPGRPTEHAIACAEMAVLDALAHTQWFAAGPPTVRIRAPSLPVPFWGSFQLAVPVYPQSRHDGIRAHVAEPTAASRPANWPSSSIR